MRINAPQKGTNIAHRHGFDPGASQLQGHCFATEPRLYAAGARVGGKFPQIKIKNLKKCNKLSIIPCILVQSPTSKHLLYGHALWLKASAHRRFFSVGDWGKFNELLIIYSISFLFFNCGNCPTLAPAVYSHGIVTKQWPRNCEALGSKSCRCAILVPFCGALILITVIYDLRA